jgi:hypothetical protein
VLLIFLFCSFIGVWSAPPGSSDIRLDRFVLSHFGRVDALAKTTGFFVSTSGRGATIAFWTDTCRIVRSEKLGDAVTALAPAGEDTVVTGTAQGLIQVCRSRLILRAADLFRGCPACCCFRNF